MPSITDFRTPSPAQTALLRPNVQLKQNCPNVVRFGSADAAPTPDPGTPAPKKTVEPTPAKAEAKTTPTPEPSAPAPKKTVEPPPAKAEAKTTPTPPPRSGRKGNGIIKTLVVLLTGVAIGGGAMRYIDTQQKAQPTPAGEHKGDEHAKADVHGKAGDAHGKTGDEHGKAADDHGKVVTKGKDDHGKGTGAGATTGAGPTSGPTTVTSVRQAESELASYYCKKANLVTAHLNTWKDKLNGNIPAYNSRLQMVKNIRDLNEAKAAMEKAGVTEAFIANPKANPSKDQVKAFHNYIIASYEAFGTLQMVSMDVVLRISEDPFTPLTKQITELKTKGGGTQAADKLIEETIQHPLQFENVWGLNLPNVHIERQNPY